MKILKHLLVIACIAGLLACGGGNNGTSVVVPANNNSSGSSITAGIDIANVHQLMVAPADITTSVLASFRKSFSAFLYAMVGITDVFAQTVQIKKVYAIDSQGNIQTLNVSELVSGRSLASSSNWVVDTPKYAIMNFDGLFRPQADGTSKQCVLLGVRKSDGQFACISTNPRCGPGSLCDPSKYLSQLKTNSTGDILYMVIGDGGLARIDITDPSNVIETNLFTHATTGDANYPVANRSSDVFISINVGGSSTISTRIFSPTGALLYTVPDSMITCSFAGGAGNEDNFFYIAGDHITGHTLYKLTKNSDQTFSRSALLTQNSNYDGLALNSTGCVSVAINGDRVFAIGADPSFLNQPNVRGNVLFEILNQRIVPTQYTLNANVSFATDLKSYSDGLVVLGVDSTTDTSAIQRVDLTTTPPTITTVLETGRFKINSMSVGSNGDISIIGVRKTDGLNIVGTFAKLNDLSSQKSLNDKPNSIASMK